MKLRTQIQNAMGEFVGETVRTLVALPLTAKPTAARLILTPGDTKFSYQRDVPGLFQPTITPSGQVLTLALNTRATLLSLKSSTFTSAKLQMDMGGSFVNIAADGTFANQASPLTPTAGNEVVLPGLTGHRFRLIDTGQAILDELIVASRPTNLRLALGKEAPFHTIAGEFSRELSVDCTAVLQAYLADAEQHQGVFVIPFRFISDTMARISVEVEIDYHHQIDVLNQLPRFKLDYTFNPTPSQNLNAMLPPGTHVLPQSRLSAQGNFESSRIALDKGRQRGEAVPVLISANRALAQLVELGSEMRITAVDLFLESKSDKVEFSLNLLPDNDGKPFGEPLLKRPVTLTLDRQDQQAAHWVNFSLGQDLLLNPKHPPWLSLQVMKGEATWHTTPENKQPLFFSETGGLSWRPLINVQKGTLGARYRLRNIPANFSMPLYLQVGSSDINLDRFAPAGQVNFQLGSQELAFACNQCLANIGENSHDLQHLINGSLARWINNRELSESNSLASLLQELPGQDLASTPVGWEVSAGRAVPVNLHEQGVVGLLGSNAGTTALSQVAAVAPHRDYQFEFWALASAEAASGELIFLSNDCGQISRHEIDIQHWTHKGAEHPFIEKASNEVEPELVLHRIKTNVPEGANQAEVRFLVPKDNALVLTDIDLRETRNAVLNGDFNENLNPDSGWQQLWQGGPEVKQENGKLTGSGNQGADAALFQKITFDKKTTFVIMLDGLIVQGQGRSFAELIWRDGVDNPLGEPLQLNLNHDGFQHTAAKGRSPDGTTTAEIRLYVPDGTTLQQVHVRLQPYTERALPFNFISQTPGELVVTDARIAFDTVAVLPQKPPQICPVTPPTSLPTESDGDCCYCCCCGESVPMQDVKAIQTIDGQPARRGNCPQCGDILVKQGGPINEAAPQVVTDGLQRSVPQPPKTLEKSKLDADKLPESPAVEETPTPPVITQNLAQVSEPATKLAALLQDPVFKPLEHFKLTTLLDWSAERLVTKVQSSTDKTK